MTAYFGDPILRAGFMPLPHLLMRHYHELNLGTDHAMFAMQLMEINWDLAQPPDTMKKLASRMGVSLRTVQRYSEHLVNQGLLIVYEQFQAGAQVENGYDLSPLFERLASFAPEPSVSGTPRERRVRETKPIAQEAPRGSTVQEGRDTLDAPLGDISVIPPHDTDVIPSPVSSVMHGNGTADAGNMTRMTGLKGKQKKINKNYQKEQTKNRPDGSSVHGQTAGPIRAVSAATITSGTGGRSLRTGTMLTIEEVNKSHMLLDRLGIHVSIRTATAPTVTPADVWSLAVYCRAARLGAGWIAKQIYDFEVRKPRASDLATRFDAVGQLLAALELDDAMESLDLVDRYCPHDLQQLEADQMLVDASSAVRLLWDVMLEVRGVPEGARLRASVVPIVGTFSSGERAYAQLWEAVLARVAPSLSQDTLTTWVHPTVLLDIQPDVAIVGTPNVFVRDEVEAHYKTLLVDALALELARPITITCVIGGA
jgi:hypothetical protein